MDIMQFWSAFVNNGTMQEVKSKKLFNYQTWVLNFVDLDIYSAGLKKKSAVSINLSH